MSDARTEVMRRVRDYLAGAREREEMPERGGAVAAYPGMPSGLESAADCTNRFHEVLERAGGKVFRVADEVEAARVLAERLESRGTRELALSDAPLVERLAADLPDEIARFDGSRDRARLLACDAGLSTAQWGIAETGTLLLNSSDERHRLVSLVPPVHIAVLRASDIVPALGAALASGRAAAPSLAGRALTLITGPSRTADIELELVVGVHGPRELDVLLLDGPAAAATA